MKYLGILFITILLATAGYWIIFKTNIFSDETPENLPTKAEINRMEEIENSSSTIDPNAVPGAGVRPVGSIPKKPAPTPPEKATTTDDDLLEN